jgi:hypothetical protein
MSDEKWWFGLVSRTFAKMCPALGIKKEVFAVHHKKHIAKVYPTYPLLLPMQPLILTLPTTPLNEGHGPRDRRVLLRRQS